MEFEHQRVLIDIRRMSKDDGTNPDIQRGPARGCFAGVPQNIDECFNQFLPVSFDRRR